MIDRLGLIDFKRFRHLDVELKQLSVLTGLNGSGKSTVVQGLLLAHQASLNSASNVPLQAWPGLDLGFASDVLNVDSADDIVRLSVTSGGTDFVWAFNSDASGGQARPYLQVLERPESIPTPLGGGGTDFVYLSAERVGPRTSHPTSPMAESELAVGEDGRFVAQALAMGARLEVDVERRHAAAGPVTTLHAQTEAWLSTLVGDTQVSAELIPRTSLATLRIRTPGRMGEWMLPTNTGFGVSYALPVVVAGLLAGNNSLLIVDSPEAHLHPSAQSAIGEFLTIVACSGVQVLIETHSDHVLNGIRKAVAVKRSLAAEQVALLFFGEGEPIRLEMDTRGKISNWPVGFFDQFERDLAALTSPGRA